MALIVDGLTWVCFIIGAVFLVAGGVGVIRLPDTYTRMHAAGLTDTMGAGLLLLGMMLQGGFSFITIKLIIILIFLWFTSPTSSYALGNAMLISGLKPLLFGGEDSPPETGANATAEADERED
jgi:multicomponent Na+:H+ antiporter subunit G